MFKVKFVERGKEYISMMKIISFFSIENIKQLTSFSV